jgi:steroid delta-isomerase-like uncharacterized protein
MGDARRISDRFTEAINSQDADAIGALYRDDAVAIDPFGEWRGKEAIVESWRGFFEAFPDIKGTDERSYDAGDTAINEWTGSGTHSGPIRTPDGDEIPPTGKRMTLRGADFITVRDGLISEHRIYFDQMQMLSQLGLVPEEAAAG